METPVVERRVRLVITELPRRVSLRLGQMGITTSELARRMGCSRPFVSRMMHRPRLTLEAFQRLTVALEVDEAWWLEPLENPRPRVSAGARLEAAARRVVSAYLRPNEKA